MPFRRFRQIRSPWQNTYCRLRIKSYHFKVYPYAGLGVRRRLWPEGFHDMEGNGKWHK